MQYSARSVTAVVLPTRRRMMEPGALMTPADYVIWFVITIVWVVAILVVGILMATGTKIRHRK